MNGDLLFLEVCPDYRKAPAPLTQTSNDRKETVAGRTGGGDDTTQQSGFSLLGIAEHLASQRVLSFTLSSRPNTEKEEAESEGLYGELCVDLRTPLSLLRTRIAAALGVKEDEFTIRARYGM